MNAWQFPERLSDVEPDGGTNLSRAIAPEEGHRIARDDSGVKGAE